MKEKSTEKKEKDRTAELLHGDGMQDVAVRELGETVTTCIDTYI